MKEKYGIWFIILWTIFWYGIGVTGGFISGLDYEYQEVPTDKYEMVVEYGMVPDTTIIYWGMVSNDSMLILGNLEKFVREMEKIMDIKISEAGYNNNWISLKATKETEIWGPCDTTYIPITKRKLKPKEE